MKSYNGTIGWYYQLLTTIGKLARQDKTSLFINLNAQG